ncbi:MAG: carbohydrate binding domain-containing protein [Roseimicrobium sp.]
MRFALLSLLITLAASPLTAADSPSPESPDWFPFTISALEGAPTAIDLSWLNEKPAGASGYLRAEGEHIVDGKGRVVRLFGTNFCFGANFPTEDIAPKIAAHLAKNGVNVVRLHHMDSNSKDSLIEDNATTKLSAAHLARLDKLIAELIAHGVFINLNLHVSREYPGTPEGAPRMSKGLDHFHPPFIALFQSYARQLLDHVNPHTGRAYKDEPGIAVIEMNNENSIALNPWWLSTLPEPFASELRTLFTKHLRGKYADTAALRVAWGLNDGSTGPDLLMNGDFAEQTKGWQQEATFGAKAGFAPLPNGEKGIRWTSTQKGELEWSLQFSQPGLALDEKAAYRLSFRARSAQSAKLGINASNAAPPWAQLGLTEKVDLTPEWQAFRFEFAPHSVLPDGKNRIVFSLLNQVAAVDLAEVKLQTIPTGFLKPDETLEAGNLRIPDRSASLAVRRDFLDFLIQLEIDHATEMKKFLREKVGAKQMITHSALLFGGIVGARREFLVSDMVDTHGYWHHPHFTKGAWDMKHWEINNVPQVAEASGGTLAEMAMQRPFGKPYSVSEYDTPAPNDYAAETFPLFAAMGCLQDWSALNHFAFQHGSAFGSDKITSFFNSDGHPAKQAFMPLAALVFRQGLIKPHHSASQLALDRTAIEAYTAQKAGDLWGSWRELWSQAQQNGALAWQQKTGYRLSEGRAGGITLTTAPAPTAVQWDTKTPSLAVASTGAALASGKLGSTPQEAVKLGPITLYPSARSAPQHNTYMLAALDGKPIEESRKLWLCALSRAENPGMGWDATRRSVSNQWGRGPALVLGVKAKISLPGTATWKVEALDPTGAPKSIVAEKAQSFAIAPEQQTVWWLLTR